MKLKLPAVLMVEGLSTVYPPPTPKVVPLAPVKTPLLVPPPDKIKPPELTLTIPVLASLLVLLKSINTVVVPAPLLV